MEKILALLDGSIYSESVCRHAAWISRRLDATIEALHVLGRREGAASSDLSGALRLGARSALLEELSELDEKRSKLAQSKGHAILEDAQKLLQEEGVGSVTSRLRKGDLVEAVREVEQDFRVVAIGKRGEGADFASGHLGSNLERIVREVKRPVFIASREFRPITKVLVAYDGSASAKAAIERIAESPVFEGLAITLLYAAPDNEASRNRLAEASDRLRNAGLEVQSRVIEGEPEKVLEKLVSDEGLDLLVMGARGHSRIRNLFIGSTTMAMIQTVKIPVLLFR